MRDPYATTVPLDDSGHVVRVYRCARPWESLTDTESAGVRYCDECRQRVFMVMSVDDVAATVAAGRCIGVSSHAAEPDQLIVGKPAPDHDYQTGDKLSWED